MPVIQGAAYTSTYNGPASLVGATVVATVTAPDQTTSTPAVTVAGSNATVTVLGAQVGQYLIVWSVTGSVTDAAQDQFSVVTPTLDLVDLASIKQDLQIAPTNTTYDAQLRRWIKAAAGVITRVCGPVLPTTEDYYLDGGGKMFVIPRRWVISITALVETIATVNYTLTEQPLGSSVNNYGYTWARSSNTVIRRGASGLAIPFAMGVQSVHITYVAGFAQIPDDIQLGANMLVRHFFKEGNLPVQSLLRGNSTDVPAVGPYLIPNAVLEVISPYALTPGIF